MAQTEDSKQALAPYVSWSTFRGLILDLRQHTPAAIDRSVLRAGRSGAQVSQLENALRFLALKDDQDRPTALCERYLKATPEQEPAVLQEMLSKAYGSALPLKDLNTMTSTLLNERLEKWGNAGSTLRKARKFFLEAAKAANVELSPRLKVRATPVRRARKASKAAGVPKAALTPPPGTASGPTTREVALLEEVIKRHKESPDGLDQWLEGVLYAMKKEMRQQA
jgi:hypothetical protein